MTGSYDLLPDRPRVYDLWQQAGGGTPAYDRHRFTALMREHGHLLGPGDAGYEEAPAAQPCGCQRYSK